MIAQIAKCKIIVWMTLFFSFTVKADTVSGYVFRTDGSKVLILDTHRSRDQYVAVTNYVNITPVGHHLTIEAKRIGVYDYYDTPIPLWEAQAAMEAQAKALAEDQRQRSVNARPQTDPNEKAILESQKKAAEEKRKKAVAANTLKWLQDQASAGDDAAQFRLGEKYLKGDGVDKDESKAREYLTKAAAQGNINAKELLATLTEQAP